MTQTTESAKDAKYWAEILFRHAHKLEKYPDCIPRMAATIKQIQDEAYNAGVLATVKVENAGI